MIEAGRELAFVWSAYLVAAAIAAGLIAWVLYDRQVQRRLLADLERSGQGRRPRA